MQKVNESLLSARVVGPPKGAFVILLFTFPAKGCHPKSSKPHPGPLTRQHTRKVTTAETTRTNPEHTATQAVPHTHGDGDFATHEAAAADPPGLGDPARPVLTPPARSRPEDIGREGRKGH